jgi:membrane protease YdiL (CAAX protease family)
MYWIYDVEMTFWLMLILIGGIFSTFGPLVGAFSVTYRDEGKNGVKKLWKRFWNLRLAGKWLAVSFLFWPILIGISFLINSYVSVTKPEFFWTSQLLVIVSWFISNFIRSGGISEEFGWRGYALPILQKRWSAFTSSILIGIVWAFWHLPLWFITGLQQGTSFQLFSINIILVSILYTWLYNNSNGSILIVVIFHAMENTLAQMFPGRITNIFYWILLILVVLIFLAIYGPEKLTLAQLNTRDSSTIKKDAK